MKRLLLVMVIACLMMAGLSAARKALLIGNASYGGREKLKNPHNDVDDFAAALRELGFSVTSLKDLNRRALREGIDDFTLKLSPVDEAVFYYSGHGAQSAGENYLIPIGASIKTPADYPYEAVSANWALQRMDEAKICIFILDACRNDPTTRSFGNKGLAKMEPKIGYQYVIFATEKDSEAMDGAGRNSPFAESFIRNVRSSNKKIEDMMKDVLSEVSRATSNQATPQTPTVYGLLREDFYFNASILPAQPRETRPQQPPQTPQPQIIINYGSILISSDVEAEVYLDSSYQGKIPANAQMRLSSVQIGNHSIELRAGTKSEIKQIRVEKDRESRLDFNIYSAQVGFVLVPGGTFTMGRTKGEGWDDELPTHSVTLNSFYIGKYEVTQAEYAQYMQPSSSWTSSYGLGGNYPAYYVSWYAAMKYCNLRSMNEGLTPVYSISGSTNPASWGAVPGSNNSTWNAAICNWTANGYRLPTEAEWEYAARGATNNPDYLYSGSDDVNTVAWYSGNNSPSGSKPVGTKAPNGLGIYDMSGNLWEWCWDWYGNYSSSPANNPTGPGSGSYRGQRGGGWNSAATSCRVACRNGGSPSYANNGNGFRLCRAGS